MTDLKIECICGVEPMREGEFPIYYKVGVDEVTRIDQGSYSPEPHCERIFYQVYKGDKLHVTVNDQAVGEVFFS